MAMLTGSRHLMPTYLLAAFLTVLSGFFFTSSHGMIRYIGDFDIALHPFEIAFFSNLFSAIFYTGKKWAANIAYK